MSLNPLNPSSQTLSSTSKPNPARVRDNQRRSRARRKEYLQELESKLRRSEALGVQASVNVQIAARGVAEENARLREENGRLKDEIKSLREMLRSSEEPTVSADECVFATGCPLKDRSTQLGPTSQVTRDRETSKPLVARTLNPELVGAAVPTASSDAEMRMPTLSPSNPPLNLLLNNLQTPQVPTDQDSEAPSTIMDSAPHTDFAATQPQCLTRTPWKGLSEELAMGNDTSSCEYAAHIITSMRADVSTDDVRADLGCGSDASEWRKCKVNNSKLFVAVDRYAG